MIEEKTKEPQSQAPAAPVKGRRSASRTALPAIAAFAPLEFKAACASGAGAGARRSEAGALPHPGQQMLIPPTMPASRSSAVHFSMRYPPSAPSGATGVLDV